MDAGAMDAASFGTGGEDLREQVRRLTELVENQATRLAELEARGAPASPVQAATAAAPDVVAAGPPGGDLTDRRALLRRVGAAAAGAVTGGVALAAAGAGPAAAANGDNLVIGTTGNAGSSTTGLTWTGAGISDAGPAVVLLKDANSAVTNTNGATLVAYRLGGGADASAIAGIDTGDGIGVRGKGDTGVRAEGAGGGIGLAATGGYAVSATATGVSGVGVYVDAPNTHLVLAPKAANPYLVGGGTRLAGSLVADDGTNLWFCTAGGTPGTWRKLAGPGTAGALHLLPAPVRVFDSRAGQVPLGSAKGAFDHQTKPIDARANASGVPLGATGVLMNLAVTETVFGGYATAWANGVADPGTANVNWSQSGATVSNLVVTALSPTGIFACKVDGVAHVIADVIGYFR